VSSISIILTCGYLTASPEENDRLKRFLEVVKAFNTLKFSDEDEVVFSEYGTQEKLSNLIDVIVAGRFEYQYIFTEGNGFNQAIAKNAGAQIAHGKYLLFINADVLLTNDCLGILRKRFSDRENVFVTCARHDIFIQNFQISNFMERINVKENYRLLDFGLDDPSWHLALKRPKETIRGKIRAFMGLKQEKVIHDFLGGYMNFGEFISYSKSLWEKYPFDPDISALVDVYARDMIFGNEPDMKLELVHDEISCFHLSGMDYMQQEVDGSSKQIRLLKDIMTGAKKNKCMNHWMVFGYYREFDSLIEELNIPFKEIFETYKTPYLWKYYRDKEHVIQKYGVTPV